ncbi:hypothetical protein N7486_009985 [Penicillium sp. IBT 16267x]|nr:hypothetical protein N7486_009985 [Penicillium sp. IBT 16267x]
MSTSQPSSPHPITNLRSPDRFDEVSASGVRRTKQWLPVNNYGPAATDVEPNDGTENGESQHEEHATERHKVKGIEDEAQTLTRN